jgi:hypothetical protein
MRDSLDNEYSYAAELIEQAVALPDGSFIEVEDLAFNVNGMGRKIAQTLQVTINGCAVSMAYIDSDQATYDLVLSRDLPVALGTYLELRQRHAGLHDRLVHVFDGLGRFTTHEMVVALVGMTARGMTDECGAATWARCHVRRSAWLLQNRFDAIATAPVRWSSLGL